MSLNKITYDTKVALNPQPSVANANKVSDSDMNEIKSVVNDAIDNLNTLNDNISAITISLSSDQNVNIQTAYAGVQIAFNKEDLKIGNKLTFDSANHQIVVGAGVHHVEISCNAVVKNGTNSLGDRYIYVNVGGSNKAQCFYQNQFATNYNYPLNIVSFICSVSENDIIKAIASSGYVETMQVRGGGNILRTFLTVKVID